VQHWVKALYNSAERAAPAEWKSLDWVSDGPPSRRPTYAVGDELLLYDVPSRSFPARARVTAEAVSRPRLVDREGGPGEGRRWPFVTEVEVLGAVDLSVAPTPLMLDVPVRQGGHWRIASDAYERAVDHVPNGFRPVRLKGPLCRPVPVERATSEPFEQRFEAATRQAYRREQSLVERLAKQLRTKGHTVTRHAITLPDGTELRSDLYDHDTGLLVEAKAHADRASLRMAIGQLLDYERFVEPAPRAKAVLVPDRPTPDLVELLDSLTVAVIWTAGGRFRDNRGGKLV
jgi:hypothetical protein